MDGPDLYIQAEEDRKDEVQDAFDAMHPAIGGRTGDGYRCGIYDPDEEAYIEDNADTMEEALAVLERVVAAHDLPYRVPDDPDTITVTERDWM